MMSGRAIPLRSDFNSDRLRNILSTCQVVKQYKRLLAIKVIYDGFSRTDAAHLVDMSMDALCYWIKRFNEYGPDGLIDIKPPGRPTKLSKSELEDLIRCVRNQQLDSDDGGSVRLVDLQGYLKRTQYLVISISALSVMLKREGIQLQTSSR